VLLVTGAQGCGKTALSLMLAAQLCLHHTLVSTADRNQLIYSDDMYLDHVCRSVLGHSMHVTDIKIYNI